MVIVRNEVRWMIRDELGKVGWDLGLWDGGWYVMWFGLFFVDMDKFGRGRWFGFFFVLKLSLG